MATKPPTRVKITTPPNKVAAPSQMPTPYVVPAPGPKGRPVVAPRITPPIMPKGC